MIKIEGVEKWYGGYKALNQIHETVEKGEVVVVCGPSGSGKSTLIRTINRLEPINSGRISVNGVDIHARGVNVNKIRSEIGFVFQSFNLFAHMTVLRNLMLAPMDVRGVSASEPSFIVDEIEEAEIGEDREHCARNEAEGRRGVR